MTFTCPYFSAKVMVKFARRGKGQRTLCGVYLNWHSSNHTCCFYPSGDNKDYASSRIVGSHYHGSTGWLSESQLA